MAEAKDNNKLIIILLIVTIVVVVGLAGFFGYFMLFKKNTGTGTATATQAKVIAEQTVKLEEFVTNLADEDKRYIKTTISVGFTDKKVADEITANMSTIRDKVNTKLWNETSVDFAGQGLEKVKKELMDSINSVLGEGKIKHIYFDNIIIQ